MSRHSNGLAWTVPFAVIGTLLAGCGSSDPSSSPPASSTAATGSGTPSPSTASAPSSPSAPAGETISIPHASLILPETWSLSRYSSEDATFNDDARHAFVGVLGESGGLPANEQPNKKNIAAEARYALTDPSYSYWHRLPDLVVNGTRLYHLRGKEVLKGFAIWHDEYGTVTHGYYITVNFDGDTTFAKRPWQLTQIAPIMATFRLR